MTSTYSFVFYPLHQIFMPCVGHVYSMFVSVCFSFDPCVRDGAEADGIVPGDSIHGLHAHPAVPGEDWCQE